MHRKPNNKNQTRNQSIAHLPQIEYNLAASGDFVPPVLSTRFFVHFSLYNFIDRWPHSTFTIPIVFATMNILIVMNPKQNLEQRERKKFMGWEKRIQNLFIPKIVFYGHHGVDLDDCACFNKQNLNPKEFFRLKC